MPKASPSMFLAAFLAFFLASAPPAAATDYYVAPGGSDAQSGTSPASAWATLQKAADTVTAGDTVHVADGNYAGFDLRRSGTALSPIVFLADGSAAAITSNNGVTPDGINVENAAHVVLDGFVVQGRTRAGIRAAVGHHITIRGCRCGNNGRWGIFTGFVDDLVIEDNETWGSVLEHGIYVSNSGDRPRIRRNHSHDNHAIGIHMNGDLSQGGDGTISEALVEDNVIHGNGVGGGSGINMDGVVDSVVRNNLLFDNHASGISLYRIDGATGSTGNLVSHNTVINASDARWCINISDASTGNTLRNNILFNHHSFRGAITLDPSSAPGFSSDYNSLMSRFSVNGGSTVISLASWQALGRDTHSFLAAPTDHFVSPSSDFHLLPTSPAIDAGTAAGSSATDLDGNPRPVGSAPDLGPYEVQLLECGDGNGDPGELCGEPDLEACADPCATCVGCTCAALDPICGDALVCGTEQCESDGDCTEGGTCVDCACVNPPLCGSGILLERARLKARASSFRLQFAADVLIPKPWTGVAPATAGLRLRVDSLSGPGLVDATLPGGTAWKTNGKGTVWTYSDRSGSVAGVTRAVIRDRSAVEDGRLRVTARGKSTAVAALPDPAAGVRASLVLGDAGECGEIVWPASSCKGGPAAFSCR
jgi:hypothetical protein